MTLDSEANIQHPDDFYQTLVDAHAGLTDEQAGLRAIEAVVRLTSWP